MKKVILAPDSFKGTMSAEEICEIMSERILMVFPWGRDSYRSGLRDCRRCAG